MSTIKELFILILNEAKAALKEYLHETNEAVKRRLKKILVLTITGAILLAVVITLLGSAALFLLIGQYKYLRLTMPAWLAWDIMGLIAIALGGVVLAVLYLIVRKQLKSQQVAT